MRTERALIDSATASSALARVLRRPFSRAAWTGAEGGGT